MQRNDSNSKIDLIEEVPVANTDSVGGSKAGIKGEPPVKTLGAIDSGGVTDPNKMTPEQYRAWRHKKVR